MLVGKIVIENVFENVSFENVNGLTIDNVIEYYSCQDSDRECD
jgi:hypothetical protein